MALTYDALLQPSKTTAYRLCEIAAHSAHFKTQVEGCKADGYEVTCVAYTTQANPSGKTAQYLATADNMGFLKFLNLETRLFHLYALNVLEAPIQRIETPWKAILMPPNHNDTVVFTLQHSNQILHSSWQASFLCPENLPLKVFEFGHHDFEVQCIAMDFSGLHLASGSCDGQLKVWKCSALLEGTEVMGSSVHDGCINALAFLEGNSQLVVTGGDDHYVRIVDVSNHCILAELVVDLAVVTQISNFLNFYTQESACLAAANKSGKLYIWGLASQQQIYCLRQHDSCAVECFTAPHHCALFATGTRDGRVTLYDRTDFSVFHVYNLNHPVVLCRLIGTEIQEMQLVAVTAKGEVYAWTLPCILSDRQQVTAQLAATVAAAVSEPPEAQNEPLINSEEEEEEEGDGEAGEPSRYRWFQPPQMSFQEKGSKPHMMLTTAIHSEADIPTSLAHLSLANTLMHSDAVPKNGEGVHPTSPKESRKLRTICSVSSPEDDDVVIKEAKQGHVAWWEKPPPPAKPKPKKKVAKVPGVKASLKPPISFKAGSQPVHHGAPRKPKGAWAQKFDARQPAASVDQAKGSTSHQAATSGNIVRDKQLSLTNHPSAKFKSESSVDISSVAPAQDNAPTTALTHAQQGSRASYLGEASQTATSSSPSSFPVSGSLLLSLASSSSSILPPPPTQPLRPPQSLQSTQFHIASTICHPDGQGHTSSMDLLDKFLAPSPTPGQCPTGSPDLPLHPFSPASEPGGNVSVNQDAQTEMEPKDSFDSVLFDTSSSIPDDDGDATTSSLVHFSSPTQQSTIAPVHHDSEDAHRIAKLPSNGHLELPLPAGQAESSTHDANVHTTNVGTDDLSRQLFFAPLADDDIGSMESEQPLTTVPQPHPQVSSATSFGHATQLQPSIPEGARGSHSEALDVPSGSPAPLHPHPQLSPVMKLNQPMLTVGHTSSLQSLHASPRRVHLMNPEKVKAINTRKATKTLEVDSSYAQPSPYRLEQLQQQYQEVQSQHHMPDMHEASKAVSDPTMWNPDVKRLARGIIDYGLNDRRFLVPPDAPDCKPQVDGGMKADPYAYCAKPIGKQVTKRWLQETQAGPKLLDHCCPDLMPQESGTIPVMRWSAPSQHSLEATIGLRDPMLDVYDRLEMLRQDDNPAKYLLISFPHL